MKIIEEEKDEILDFFPTVKILEDRIQNQTITIYKNITLDDLNVFLEIFSNKTYIVVMFIFFFGCANSFFNFTVNKISKNLWVFLLISIILIILINIIIKKSKVKCEISSEKKKTCLK